MVAERREERQSDRPGRSRRRRDHDDGRLQECLRSIPENSRHSTTCTFLTLTSEKEAADEIPAVQRKRRFHARHGSRSHRNAAKFTRGGRLLTGRPADVTPSPVPVNRLNMQIRELSFSRTVIIVVDSSEVKNQKLLPSRSDARVLAAVREQRLGM